MRLYISGHSRSKGFSISKEWSNAECSALPAMPWDEFEPVRYVNSRDYAMNLIARWNKRFATHEAGDERMPNHMPEYHSITFHPAGSYESKRVGRPEQGVYCLQSGMDHTTWSTFEQALGEALKLGTRPLRWSLDHPKNIHSNPISVR